MNFEKVSDFVSQNTFCLVVVAFSVFFGVSLFATNTASGYGYSYGYGYDCNDTDTSDSSDQDSNDNDKQKDSRKKEKKRNEVKKVSIRKCFDPTIGKIVYRVVVYGEHFDRNPRLKFEGKKPYKITEKGRSKIIAYFLKPENSNGGKVKLKLKSRDKDFEDYSEKYWLDKIKEIEPRKIYRISKHK
jgi:hypothetical protein